MQIKESSEDYLEKILILSQKNSVVRSIDIVNYMKVSKPSVSVAMKKLRENGYILMDTDGYITLTEEGDKIAQKMYERHIFITQWLQDLGVPKEIASNDACKIEHVLSVETFDAIKRKYKNCKCKNCDGCK
ncbi:MAG: metal-dependent transcriptional regulator [Ruminococcus sp.]